MKLILIQLKILAPFLALSLLFLFLEVLFPQSALIHVLSNGSDFLLLAVALAMVATFCIFDIKDSLPNRPVLSAILGILFFAVAFLAALLLTRNYFDSIFAAAGAAGAVAWTIVWTIARIFHFIFLRHPPP